VADEADPRLYFAAERTLLAWIRTGLAVVGLGFVVARFGLFLQMMRSGAGAKPHVGSTVIGVALVLLGAAAIAVAAWQHTQFCRSMPTSALPRPYVVRWPVWFATMIAAVGAVLAAYLLMRAIG
jgi:putative membrane protein